MKATTLNDGTLRVKCEGCIVDILEGERDGEGRKVTEVSIIPDNFKPDNFWHLLGQSNNKLVQSNNLKVVKF